MKIIPDQAHCEFLILNASIDAGGRSTEDSAFVGGRCTRLWDSPQFRHNYLATALSSTGDNCTSALNNKNSGLGLLWQEPGPPTQL